MRSGIGVLILAMFLTPAVDGVAKALSADHTPMTIAFLRYLTAGLVALLTARAGRRPIAVPKGDRAGQLLRTVLLVAAMTALIAALGMVPMAKAVGGFLVAPIASALLGILVWCEPPTAPRLAGAAISFAGAALLLRPEAGFDPGCLFALLGGALLGTYLAATRGARARTDALSTLAVQSLLGALLLAPFALRGGLPPPTPGLVLGALALGSGSATCHFLTVAAYQRADATVLAPFLYFNLVTAAVAGFLVFGETVDRGAVLGLLAIVMGGLVALVPPTGSRPRQALAVRPRFA